MLLWKVSVILDFSATSKIPTLCLVHYSVTAIWTTWSFVVLFLRPLIIRTLRGHPLLSSHPTHPQEILCTHRCFYSLKLDVLQNGNEKWKIIEISTVKEGREQLMKSIIAVVICRYKISFKFNGNPKCKSSWVLCKLMWLLIGVQLPSSGLAVISL